MKRATLVAAAVLVVACGGGAAWAQTAIETDGEVKAQGFDGDGSKMTNVDAATLGGEASGFFATAAELLAAIEALDNADGPCFDNTSRFVNCGNGTVTDTVTGLIWLYDANCSGTQDWGTANQTAAALANGSCGLTDGSRAGDWRLPTGMEWLGIALPSCSAPKIVGNGTDSSSSCHSVDGWASGVQTSGYWSSETYTGFTGNALIMEMDEGNVSPLPKSFSRRVWPVRGGQ